MIDTEHIAVYRTCSGCTKQNVRGRCGCASHNVLYGLVLLFVILQLLVEKPEKPTGDDQRNNMRAETSLICQIPAESIFMCSQNCNGFHKQPLYSTLFKL